MIGNHKSQSSILEIGMMVFNYHFQAYRGPGIGGEREKFCGEAQLAYCFPSTLFIGWTQLKV